MEANVVSSLLTFRVSFKEVANLQKTDDLFLFTKEILSTFHATNIFENIKPLIFWF